MLLMQPTGIKLIEIKPLLLQGPPESYFYKLHNSPLIQKTKIPRSLTQAIASNHRTAFTFTLALSKGRVGGTWELKTK
jgi:hypothetical protein